MSAISEAEEGQTAGVLKPQVKFDVKPRARSVRVIAESVPFQGSGDSWACLEDLIVFQRKQPGLMRL
jgi:hypothetical protein